MIMNYYYKPHPLKIKPKWSMFNLTIITNDGSGFSSLGGVLTFSKTYQKLWSYQLISVV